MENNTKKYWLKLEEGFLDSGHIKVLKSKENGRDLILFYLAIMLKSIKSDGHLRFSDTVPYDEIMLAAVTDTDFETVRQATANLKSLGLLEVLGNGTMFLTDMPKRVGRESDSTERVRAYRAKEKSLQCNGDVTDCNSDVTICNDNKEQEKRKDLEEDKKHKKKRDKPPGGGAVAFDEIISSYSSDEELKRALYEFIEHRKFIKKPLSDSGLRKTLLHLDKLSGDGTDKLEIINCAIRSSWTGLYKPKVDNTPSTGKDPAKQKINYDED